MQKYRGYIIIDPYEDHEWFAQWTAGEDMQLRAMDICAPGEVCFYPEDLKMQGQVDRLRGHPSALYSGACPSVEAAQHAIDEWIPIRAAQEVADRAFRASLL